MRRSTSFWLWVLLALVLLVLLLLFRSPHEPGTPPGPHPEEGVVHGDD